MPFEISWYVEGMIIHDQTSGDVTWDEIAAKAPIINEMMDQSKPPFVHIIYDIAPGTTFPDDSKVFKAQQRVPYLARQEMGWFILLGANRLEEFVNHVLTQRHKVRFRPLGSFDEALEFLQMMDARLIEALADDHP